MYLSVPHSLHRLWIILHLSPIRSSLPISKKTPPPSPNPKGKKKHTRAKIISKEKKKKSSEERQIW
jgi:hypothetical protein